MPGCEADPEQPGFPEYYWPSLVTACAAKGTDMAELIPPLNSCLSRMQAGEKRFARRLMSHLEDDYLCWYETGIGHRPRYTDFVILHPMRGLLLLVQLRGSSAGGSARS